MSFHRKNGVSLIEAVVAILIFSFIILFVFELFISSYQEYEQTRADTVLSNLAQQEIEKVREQILANPASPPSNNIGPSGNFAAPYSQYHYQVTYSAPNYPSISNKIVEIQVEIKGPVSSPAGTSTPQTKKMTLTSLLAINNSIPAAPPPSVISTIPPTPPTPGIDP